jgi:hypothetical protein
MTTRDLSRATRELRAAMRLMPRAETSAEAHQDAVYHVNIAHLLLTCPSDGIIISSQSHSPENCLACIHARTAEAHKRP